MNLRPLVALGWCAVLAPAMAAEPASRQAGVLRFNP
jgi:hypothetical protein